MIDSQAFTALIARVRAGDQAAARELIEQYEPLIRREVRLRLEDGRLRSVLESLDICQSVFASFFVRTGLGEYDLDDPPQLVRLLVSMTRNKVASVARREYRQKRDRRRVIQGDEVLSQTPQQQETPSQFVSDKELLAASQRLLDPVDRQIADWRAEGLTWDQIASRLDSNAQATRVRFSRAVKRVLLELGLQEETDSEAE